RHKNELRARFQAVFRWPEPPPPVPGHHRSRYALRPVDIKRKIMDATDVHHQLVYSLKGTKNAGNVYCRVGGEGVVDQGEMASKRAGASQHIDQGARRKAGHVDVATIQDLDANRYLRAKRQEIRDLVTVKLMSLGRDWCRLSTEAAGSTIPRRNGASTAPLTTAQAGDSGLIVPST
ncbi:hypothetical protein ACLF3G_14255, partial [Falsiroseomonas sp. HC035]|uniref:hypothetical protein n=1 Tax=Falsiroseomonas sp. HC035 TaxID=3390999 RepID=UPI003D317878